MLASTLSGVDPASTCLADYLVSGYWLTSHAWESLRGDWVGGYNVLDAGEDGWCGYGCSTCVCSER